MVALASSTSGSVVVSPPTRRRTWGMAEVCVNGRRFGNPNAHLEKSALFQTVVGRRTSSSGELVLSMEPGEAMSHSRALFFSLLVSSGL